MSIFSVIGGIISPVSKLIDDLHTSEEEKLTLRNQFKDMENQLALRSLKSYEATLEAKSNIIVSEAKADSWLTKSWRPITMLTFLGLIVLNSFGLLVNQLNDAAWTLLQIGIGGYIGGRSLERIAKVVEPMVKKKKGGE